MGSGRLYHSCQCQLYSGTLRMVSFLPSGNTNLNSNAFPRECMCGCKPTSFTSLRTSNVASTLKSGSPGGILNVPLEAESVSTRSFGDVFVKTSPSLVWSVVGFPFGG